MRRDSGLREDRSRQWRRANGRTTCAGRETQKRKGFFETADGKVPGAEITEEQYKETLLADTTGKPGVMETEVIVREEIKSCGAILGRNKGNIFGSA